MKTDEIRERFLEYFRKQGHTVVPSDSLVPPDDPSLLFTGAGMNQFKDLFLGTGKKEYSRATSCQKCLRTGDIENVGRTAAHMTFFEMLGNFSFGDYFKRESINWAWDFLLTEFKLPEEKLCVSVYKDDNEAYAIWADEIGVPAAKIYRFDADENFWPANAVEDGPNGPCGPCSEIFYDFGPQVGCRRKECEPSCDCDRFVEQWNLVFTQYDRRDGGELTELPQKNIDTGMGLERIASLMQGKSTNFEIDIFLPLLDAICQTTSVRYGEADESNRRIRRIADHSRAAVFMISDGVLPANEGRGYVLRRLLRRAVSDGIALGASDNFVYHLVPVITDAMKAPYPELTGRRENIARLVKAEEEHFRETLVVGGEMLERVFEELKRKGERTVSGPGAFRLYDTYGYPVEFIAEKAGERGYTVDLAGFEREMEGQRERARSASKIAEDIFASVRGPVHELASRIPSTGFLGYEQTRIETSVAAVIRGEELVDSAAEGDDGIILVLESTVFYAEAGGQVGDTGKIRGDEFVFEVSDMQSREGLHLHIGRVSHGAVSAGAAAVAEIDVERRLNIMRNHTATHLLHHALRRRLGDHVEQAGSLVAPDRFRFDFTHFQAMRTEEIRDVERIVNGAIVEDLAVLTSQTSLQQAREEGVIALFGEKYGEEVRVVRIGDLSAELCGGTHLERSGSIGLFKILSEESVARGVRRITAVTAMTAVGEVHRLESELETMALALDVPLSRVSERVEEIVGETKDLRRKLSDVAAERASSAAKDLLASVRPLTHLRAVVERLDGLTVDDLRRCADGLKAEQGLIAILGSVKDDRPSLIVCASPDLVAKGFDAVAIARRAAAKIKGGGGGKATMAQAGGKDPSGLDAALEEGFAAAREADTSLGGA
ncbi:MAG: alanine--tRNA ligase [Planctomycetota bacterium]|jgi:alanyl-tRNA synthetase